MSRTPYMRYRDRLDRLRRRAQFLRDRLARSETRESSHDIAEISALEWAVNQLAPWFEDAPVPVIACCHCGYRMSETERNRALGLGRATNAVRLSVDEPGVSLRA